MKKLGFTLAEVLITLAIVGIIAALTIPGLTRNVSQKSIGPALAKAVNSLNSMNKEALENEGITSLDRISTNYIDTLETYMAGMRIFGMTRYLSNDGISYDVGALGDAVEQKVPGDAGYEDCNQAPDQELCKRLNVKSRIATEKYAYKFWKVIIDINGEKGKNASAGGYEQFTVYVDTYGKVILAGSEEAVEYGIPAETEILDCKDSAATISDRCTATVAKYGWEVTY